MNFSIILNEVYMHIPLFGRYTCTYSGSFNVLLGLQLEFLHKGLGLVEWLKYTREKQASCIIRGLRAISDFEYEFQMTGMNAKLDPEIETVFLMAADKWQFVSSSFVKEIAILDGDVSEFVTEPVIKALKEKLKK